MVTKHKLLDWPESLIGKRFGAQVITSIASVVRGAGRSQRTKVFALCDCGAKEMVTLHALRARARAGSGTCKACRKPPGGKKGRTWRVTCPRCGGKGHHARTCKEPRR